MTTLLNAAAPGRNQAMGNLGKKEIYIFYNLLPTVSICQWHIPFRGVHKSVRQTEPINMYEILLGPYTKPPSYNVIFSCSFIIPFLSESLQWKRILVELISTACLFSNLFTPKHYNIYDMAGNWFRYPWRFAYIGECIDEKEIFRSGIGLQLIWSIFICARLLTRF